MFEGCINIPTRSEAYLVLGRCSLPFQSLILTVQLCGALLQGLCLLGYEGKLEAFLLLQNMRHSIILETEAIF